MKLKRFLLALLFTVSFGLVHGQDGGFEDFLKGGTDDANVLFNHYMNPFLRGMGYGFNNGWYNTAEPHKSFGFDLTFSMNAALVPEADQVFEFVESEYQFTRLLVGGSATLPTLMGGNTTQVLQNYANTNDLPPQTPPLPPDIEIPLGIYDAPNGIADDLKPYTFNQVAVPSPIVQVGLGLVAGTELKVRWLPTITNEDFNFKYWGIGGLHSISQWIPGLKDVPVDISAFVGYTAIDAEYNIPAGSIEGEFQKAQFRVSTLTYQALVSAHVSVLTVYGGLGMDNFTTSFKMLGTYDVYPGVVPELRDPINLEQSGNGSFRTTLGARLKLAIITIHADYTFREYNTLTVGLGFSVR